MRAYVIDEPFGIGSLRVVERPMPQPGPGEVLVQVNAVALNYRDLMVVTGRWRPSGERIPVSDGAGVVLGVGDGVTRFAPGDRVVGCFFPNWIDGDPTPGKLSGSLGGTAADGLLATHAVLHEDALVRAPAHLSDEEAATLPCAAVTAWHALMGRSRTLAGDTVVVQGTGGVSLFAAQFARMAGATVIATSSSDSKLERMRALGAAHGINYRDTPAWEARVLELTDGRGADHVIDIAGGDNLNRSLAAARLGGTVSLVGFLGGAHGAVETFLLAEKNLRLNGILVGSRAMFEEMNAAIARDAMRPVMDRVVGWEEVSSALRVLGEGGVFGKVGVRVVGGG